MRGDWLDGDITSRFGIVRRTGKEGTSEAKQTGKSRCARRKCGVFGWCVHAHVQTQVHQLLDCFFLKAMIVLQELEYGI